MSAARYAIYYAPHRDDPLTDRAAAWLGRCAWTGAPISQPGVADLADLDPDNLTADPRHYGFHATLRAPFELAADKAEADLRAGCAAFAASHEPFTAAIAPAALGQFIAFRPLDAEGEQRLRALHAETMEHFQPYRAPLSEADLARRRKAGLTPNQDAKLLAYGYPYIFEEFRFHMTLTGRIKHEAIRARVVCALQEHFAPHAGPHRFDAIALFAQQTRDAPFTILERFEFAA